MSNNIIPLAGAEVGDKIGPHVATRAIKVRHRQASAMLEAAAALTTIRELNELDGPRSVISSDLEKVAQYLYHNAL